MDVLCPREPYGTRFAPDKEIKRGENSMSIINEMISRVLDVRSMTPVDLPRVLQLEKQRLGSSWLRHDIAMNPVTEERATWVATIQNHVVGYLVYQLMAECAPVGSGPHLEPARLLKGKRKTACPPICVDLLQVYVAPDWRRRGIGRALLSRFDPRPSRDGMCTIEAAVPETNLAMQLLLRSVGYKATRVLRAFHGDEDAYLMHFERS
jgi:ribosomal protein S18 acetylase RimI-like enzyme